MSKPSSPDWTKRSTKIQHSPPGQGSASDSPAYNLRSTKTTASEQEFSGKIKDTILKTINKIISKSPSPDKPNLNSSSEDLSSSSISYTEETQPANIVITLVEEIPERNTLQVPNLNFTEEKMAITPEKIQSTVDALVPVFGEPDTSPNSAVFFIESCKRVMKRYQGDDAALKLALEAVIFRLRGSPFEYFCDSPANSLADFCKTMSQKYLPRVPLEQLRDKLLTAKQSSSESCREFGDRVRILAKEYSTGVRSKHGEENPLPAPLLASMEQEVYLKGLRNMVIKSALIVITNKTTAELIETAENLESRISATQSFGSSTETTQCQLCDRTGHQAKECRTIKQSPIKIQPPRILQNPQKYCRYCKEVGHEIPECISKQRSDERRGFGNSVGPQYSGNKQNYAPYNQPSQIRPTQPNNFQTYRTQYQQPGPSRQAVPNQRDWQPRYLPQQQPSNSQYRPTQPQQQRNWQNQPPPRNSPKKHVEFSPTRNRFRNSPTGLEKGMQNLSINYIEDDQYELTQDQGNEHGLADQTQ